MLRRLGLLAFLLAGCASSSQLPADLGQSPKPIERVAERTVGHPAARSRPLRSSWSIFIPKHFEGEAPRQFFGLVSAAELKPEAPPRPVAPEGVACAIYGTGTGLTDSCNSRSTVVHDARTGGRPIASFDPEGVEVAWGVMPGRGFGWTHYEDDTFVLDGFADLSKETFTLLREVSIVDDHVWLKQGIPVGILGAEKSGVAVSFEDAVPGVDDVPARVACDALLFEPAPPKPEPDPAATPAEPEYAGSAVDKLKVYSIPDGPVITTLAKKDGSLGVLFEVVERQGAWTRVKFETDKAKFDVWARSKELDLESFGLAGIGLAGCGVSRCGGGAPPLDFVARRTPVIVGDAPDHEPSPGLTLKAEAPVVVVSERGGYVEVLGYGSRVRAPDGSSFWIPKSALKN